MLALTRDHIEVWQRQPRFYCQRVQRQTEEGKIVIKMASRANLGCLPRSDSLSDNNNDQITIIMTVVMLMMITQVIIEWR